MTIKIINKNCLDGMRELDDDSIDIIITSIPFREEDVDGDYWELIDNFMKEAFRIIKNYIVVFQSSTKIWDMCQKYPKPFHICIWTKPNLMLYSRKYNPIFIYMDKNADFNLNKTLFDDVYPYTVRKGEQKTHKYEDPLYLYIHLLKKFPRYYKVLDPFMGSGTSACACKSLGMDFIGFEINPEYCKIAERRLAQQIITSLNEGCEKV